MTNTNLLQAMGRIDPRLIADAAPDAPQKKSTNKTWVKWASLAACFALAVIIAIPFINNPSMDGIDVTIYGTFVDTSIEDSTKLENYAWFDVEVKRGEEFVATVQLKLNDKNSAAVYVKNHSLVEETTINGVQVFYAYNADMEYWDSVLEVEGNYYNIHIYSADEQGFIDFLNVLLEI